nr:hypothetical protein [Xanthomonas arboricola]MDN0205075.1 hypothetical protein [Xanthomonas arboricola pv. corylina]MDN0217978.1 hypothetical protein [Xanthomonas arboricola pv. corylina]
MLNKLVEHGLIDKDVSTNRLYLPVEGKLADEIETSPHRGRSRSSYTKAIVGYIDDLIDSPDGEAAMRNDAAALDVPPILSSTPVWSPIPYPQGDWT